MVFARYLTQGIRHGMQDIGAKSIENLQGMLQPPGKGIAPSEPIRELENPRFRNGL